MDINIGVGLIVGLVIATTLYVYNTDRFNTVQKIILYMCVIFPPAQWLLILIFLTLDYTIDTNSKETKERREIIKQASNYDSKLDYLKDLKDKELLTEEEYNQKAEKINSEKKDTEIKQTEEYIKLKSLYDDGILTKEEFEDKISKIKIENSIFNFYKIKSGKNFKIGKFEEYYVENKYGKKFKNIYKSLSSNKFFIYKNGKLYFLTINQN